MRRTRRPSRLSITLLFTLVVFCILLITMAVVGAGLYVLYHIGVLSPIMREKYVFPTTLLIFIIASIVVGTFLSLFISHIPLRPFHILADGMSQLAKGNYKTRIDLGNIWLWKNLSECFNLMAEELENTEMLRSDFVNGFSHEFKTPIVSILGFAKLLNRGNIPPEQQREYLRIIEEESSRLSAMATNVLNMTKIENQSILTDVTEYDLSEQLRTCLLLLEKKWTRKNLQISAEFDEYMVCANEEIMKQVWLNILDNAVKFTPDNGEVSVSIQKEADHIITNIKNTGSEISVENQSRIFKKFYQEDTSHTTEGNGLGLAIAYKIVQLHEGEISVSSHDKETIFSVTLPC